MVKIEILIDEGYKEYKEGTDFSGAVRPSPPIFHHGLQCIDNGDARMRRFATKIALLDYVKGEWAVIASVRSWMNPFLNCQKARDGFTHFFMVILAEASPPDDSPPHEVSERW